MKTKNLSKNIDGIFDAAMNNYRYDYGIRKIEEAVATHPDLLNEDMLCKLGVLYDHSGMKESSRVLRRRHEEHAFSLYRRALKVNPNSYRATWGIGRVWLHRRSRKAIPYALKAYHLKKRSGEKVGLYAQNIGLVYEALEDYRNAEKWLLRGLYENRTDYGSYLNLVVFYRMIRKDFKKAKRYAIVLEKLYHDEKEGFKRTAWGKKISQFIKENLYAKK